MADAGHESLPQRQQKRSRPRDDPEDSPTAEVAEAKETTEATNTAESPAAAEESAADPPTTGGEAAAEAKAPPPPDAQSPSPPTDDADDKVLASGTSLPAAPSAPHTERQYEYLDHTADVQLHAWGRTTEEAFEYTVLAMCDYVTDLSTVDIDPARTLEVEVKGHDMSSLLFAFMDEFLFHFSAELFAVKDISIVSFDRETFTIRARAWGEKFVIGKHPQGTEVKAITFSNMQIWEREAGTETFVIVDI